MTSSRRFAAALLAVIVSSGISGHAQSTAPFPASGTNAGTNSAPTVSLPATAAPAPTPRLDPRETQLLTDWPQLARYRDADVALGPPAAGQARVVFYGDSITESWPLAVSFPGQRYVNRGISGQTTPQMLVRFRQDVIDLKPAVVVILAATNDIARNTGVETVQQIEDNFAGMCDIAEAHGIRVVLSSTTPVYDYPWKRGMDPVTKIAALNAWMKSYAAEHREVYLDYYTAMATPSGAMRDGLSIGDGVHPSAAGYAVMAPLAEKAIAEALR